MRSSRTLWIAGAGAAALAALIGAGGPAKAAGTLVWGDQLPAALDPHTVYDVPMQFVLLNAYDALYQYIGNPPIIEPRLALRHTVTPDGITWDYKLRPGVKFHDGSELTADDVIYSFKRLLALNKGPAAAFKPVLKPENVTAPDKYSVRFVLNEPYAPFHAAVPLVAIVNPRAIAPHVKGDDWGSEWLSSNGAGSGAYRIEPANYRRNESLDMVRFNDHFLGWGHNPNPVDSIKSRPTLETSTRILALLKGDIHATDSYLPTDQVERVQKSKGVRVAQDESMRVFIIRINNAKPPFDNVHARRCLSHAFNYDGFIGDILKNYAERNAGPIPKNLWGAPADLKGYDFDLAKAKAECDKARAAGAPMDREIEIHTQSQYDQTIQAAQLFQSDLKRIGLNVKIVPSLWPTLTASTVKKESTPDMWIHWVSTYFVDPENWIGQMYDSQFHGTWKASAWYKNDQVDKLLRTARGEPDQAKRKTLYEAASRIVVDEAADIWVYNTVQLRGLSDKVKGYAFSPVGSGGEIRTVSLSN